MSLIKQSRRLKTKTWGLERIRELLKLGIKVAKTNRPEIYEGPDKLRDDRNQNWSTFL